MEASISQLRNVLNGERADLEREKGELPTGSRGVPPPSNTEARRTQLDISVASVDRQLSALDQYSRGERYTE